MKIGYSLLGMSFRVQRAVAQAAEKAGVESVWIPEHLVYPDPVPATYPYSSDGSAAAAQPGTPLFDPWVALSALAATTEKLRLATNVYILPLRHPIITARAVVTLDRISRGRVTIGAGLGWLEGEFAALGEAFHGRGDRANEIIAIMRRLWTDEVIEHHGQFYNFGPVRFEPKPIQDPYPPIEIGGISPAALARAGTLGDGWIDPGGSDLAETQERIRAVNRHRRVAERLDSPFEFTVGYYEGDPSIDTLRALVDMGVTRVIFAPRLRAGERGISAEDATRHIDQVVGSVQSALGA
jgi:probable F420-dependent oxidoreductase